MVLRRQFITPLGQGGGFGGLMDRDRRRALRQPSPEELEQIRAERRGERLEGRRKEGREYGYSIAEAAVNISLHNAQQVPDDWDFVPEYRRPFIAFEDGTPKGRWRLSPPAVSITDVEEIEAWVAGVNQGLAAHRRVEEFFAPIAEALNLIALALTTSAAGRAFVSAPPRAPAGPPRLTVVQGGGGRPTAAIPAAPPPSAVRSLPVGQGAPPAGAQARASGQAALAPAQAPAAVPAPAAQPAPLRLVHSQPASAVTPAPQAGPVSPPMRSPLPLPHPDLDRDIDPNHPEQDEHGCRYEPIAQQFGRYPCHADFATSISGVRREIRVTTPEGLSVDFDAMDYGGALYEVKTGYRWVPFTPNDAARQAVLMRFTMQAINQMIVAARCGRTLSWYFNEAPAATFFDANLPVHPVHHVPFRCDLDSDG